VMRGYRADTYTQIETLVFMALYERAHAVFMRNLEAKITEPVLKRLVGRIANDEERHEEFFHNLVAHCLEQHPDQTIGAIVRRSAGLGVVGGDILEYSDKLRVIADAGIFDRDTALKVVSDRIVAWGLSEDPQLEKFVRA
jgi:acyl-[acyl-carrier-protein] desaturase